MRGTQFSDRICDCTPGDSSCDLQLGRSQKQAGKPPLLVRSCDARFKLSGVFFSVLRTHDRTPDNGDQQQSAIASALTLENNCGAASVGMWRGPKNVNLDLACFSEGLQSQDLVLDSRAPEQCLLGCFERIYPDRCEVTGRFEAHVLHSDQTAKVVEKDAVPTLWHVGIDIRDQPEVFFSQDTPTIVHPTELHCL